MVNKKLTEEEVETLALGRALKELFNENQTRAILIQMLLFVFKNDKNKMFSYLDEMKSKINETH